MLLKVTQARFVTFEDVQLRPGSDNRVSSKQFERMKKNPVFKALMDDGVIEEVDGADSESADLEAHREQLKAMDPKKAAALVRDCTDDELLKVWADSETRASVKRAITEQQKKLSEQGEMRSKKGAEGIDGGPGSEEDDDDGGDGDPNKAPLTAHVTSGKGATTGHANQGNTQTTLGGKPAGK